MLSNLIGLLLLTGTTTPLWDESYKTITPKQDIYLARLMDCESSGSSTIKIVDSNNYYSYGAFQFQLGTWIGESEKYNLGYSKKDIFDWQKQKFLAHLMLLDGGRKHWYNCTKKLGDYPK